MIIQNSKDTEEKIWHVYIRAKEMGIDKHYKYNFIGTKKDLFTLIGTIYSTWFMHINDIRYMDENFIDTSAKMISVIAWKDSYKTFEREV